MNTSLLLVVVLGGTGVLFYVLGVVLGDRRRPLLGRMLAPKLLGLLAVCLLFAAVAGFTDRSVAEETLHEATLPAGSTTTQVVVEHSDATHRIMVGPEQSGPRTTDTVDVHVRVTDASGRVLVDEWRTSRWVCRSRSACGWDAVYASATPGADGPLTITTSSPTAGVGALHLAVFDADKTDGERMAGY